MTSEANQNVAPDLQAQIRELQAVVEKVSNDLAGHPVQEVKDALQREVDALGNGATIADPDVAAGAQTISEGKPLRLSADGRLETAD